MFSSRFKVTIFDLKFDEFPPREQAGGSFGQFDVVVEQVAGEDGGIDCDHRVFVASSRILSMAPMRRFSLASESFSRFGLASIPKPSAT